MAVLKILIIEDETVSAMELENCLEDFGYNVVGVAANYKQAMKLFKEKKPDLILMDVELKGSKLDGIQIMKEFKKTRTVPVIYLTAHYNNAQIQQRVIASNPENFLFKPHDLNPSKLAVAIELAIRKFTNNEDAELQTGIYQKGNYLFIKKEFVHYRTAITEISHVMTLDGGIIIFAEENNFPFNVTMKKFIQKVKNHNDLIQVHQSYVVNLNRVKAFSLKENTTTIEYKFLVKENGEFRVKTKHTQIPIGREYKNRFLQKLNALDTKS